MVRRSVDGVCGWGGMVGEVTDRPNRTFTLYVGKYEIKVLSRGVCRCKPMLTAMIHTSSLKIKIETISELYDYD